MKTEQEELYKTMTATLQAIHGNENTAEYIRWIIKSDAAKEYYCSSRRDKDVQHSIDIEAVKHDFFEYWAKNAGEHEKLFEFFRPHIQPAQSDAVEFVEHVVENGWRYNYVQNMWRNDNGISIMSWPTPPLCVNTKALYRHFLTQKQKL